jgi:hypothetical protein
MADFSIVDLLEGFHSNVPYKMSKLPKQAHSREYSVQCGEDHGLLGYRQKGVLPCTDSSICDKFKI